VIVERRLGISYHERGPSWAAHRQIACLSYGVWGIGPSLHVRPVRAIGGRAKGVGPCFRRSHPTTNKKGDNGQEVVSNTCSVSSYRVWRVAFQ